jgi:hypothetical protein
MDKDAIILTLKELKQVMTELQKVHNTLGTEDDNYYNMETLIVFVKLIYCKLRNSILKDPEIRKMLS